MWHWLPKKRNKHLFLLELVAISTIAHLIGCIYVFVIYTNGPSSMHINIGGTKNRNPTLFISPQHTSLKEQMRNKKRSGKSHTKISRKNQATQIVSHTARIHHLASDTSFIEELRQPPSKKIIKENKKTPTPTLRKESAKAKKASELKKQEQSQQKPKTRKSLEKPVPEVVPEPEQIKQEVKKNVQTETLTAQAASEPDAPITAPGTDDVTQVATDAATVADDFEGCVGDYVSAEQARISEVVEHEILTYWKPPKGMPKNLVCEIKVIIGGNGKVTLCTTAQSSGVLIYDMSARTAARAINLPQWAYGKEFTIAFKQ